MTLQMIYFLYKVRPFETFAQYASMVVDESVIIVFLLFALYFYFWPNTAPEKAKGIAYALVGIIVLSIIKNLATLFIASYRTFKERRLKKKKERELVP